MADPSTLSGKRLWLRAKDNAGANGSTVSSWADQSGLSNNATGVSTPTVATASTPNSGKSVAFANAGYFTLPNIMSGAAEGEAWVVIKETTAVTQTAFWQMGTDTLESHYPYSGTIYEAFGMASGRVSWTPTLAVDQWRIYRVQMISGGTFTAWLDNVRQIVATGKTVSWTSSPTLGAGKNSGSVDMKFSGNIAEIVVFDRPLSTAEAADLTGYFNTEHGLTVGSPLTVVEVGTPGNITTAGTSGTCSIATTPAAGDKVFVVVDLKTSSNNQTPTSVSVSGLGGTWVQRDRQAVTGGSGNVGVAHELWECANPTSSGTVTVSWTNNSQGTLRIMTVRGFTGATVVSGSNTQNTAAVTGTFTGPSANAQIGGLVIAAQYDGFANTSNGSLFSTVVPSTGWTIGTPLQPGIGGKWNVGYRLPTEATATGHRTDFDNAGFSGGPALITEWIVTPSTVIGAQVEVVYAETLVAMTPDARVESVYAEVLDIPALTTAQVEGVYVEVLAETAPAIPTTTVAFPAGVAFGVTAASGVTATPHPLTPIGLNTARPEDIQFSWVIDNDPTHVPSIYTYAADVEVQTADGLTNVISWTPMYLYGSFGFGWEVPQQWVGVPLRWRVRNYDSAMNVTAWSAWNTFSTQRVLKVAYPVTVGFRTPPGTAKTSFPVSVGFSARAYVPFKIDFSAGSSLDIHFLSQTINAIEFTAESTLEIVQFTGLQEDVYLDFRADSLMDLKIPRQRVIDPVTGKAPYKLVVVDMDGNRIGEVAKAVIAPMLDTLNSLSSIEFTVPAMDPMTAELVAPKAEVQLWRGRDLMGWFVVNKARGATADVTYSCFSVDWYLTKRVVGKVPIPNLLKNGSFEQGEKYWSFGYVSGSLPAKPPLHTIVDKAIRGKKALQLAGASGTYKGDVILAGDVHFAFDSYALTSAGISEIKNFCDDIPIPNPIIRVEGHTDNVGSSSYNMTLSYRRANSARAEILKNKPEAQVSAIGYGETRPIATNSTPAGRAQNRRAEMKFTGAVGAAGNRQYAGQALTYTNAKANKYNKVLTLVVWFFVTDFKNPNKDSWAFSVERTDPASSTPSKVLSRGMIPLTKETYTNRWVRGETTCIVPPDGKAYRITVRLWPPDGHVIYDEATLTENAALAFYDVDEALIVKGLVEHAQDPAMGKSDLRLGTYTPTTKIKRERIYPWIERKQISELVSEFPTLADGVDVSLAVSATDRVIQTHFPRKGLDRGYVLALESNIATFSVDFDGDQTATQIIVQADNSEGGDREEGYATDTSKMDGIIMEKVYNATPGSAISSLEAQALRGLKRYARPVIIPSVTMDPKFTDELLDNVGLGDVVRVVVHKGWIDVDAKYRVVSRSLDPSSDALTYTLTPEDVT